MPTGERVNTVNVYIDSTYYPNPGNGAYAALCGGVQSWTGTDGVTYSCHSSSGLPPTTTQAPYLYIAQLRSGQSAKKAFTDPNGTWTGTNQDTVYDDRFAQRTAVLPWPKYKVTVVETWVDAGIPVSEMTGLMAHENGHLHYFLNCGSPANPICENNSPSTPSSVMGSQYTLSSNQPKAPTDCDKYWWAQYK